MSKIHHYVTTHLAYTLHYYDSSSLHAMFVPRPKGLLEGHDVKTGLQLPSYASRYLANTVYGTGAQVHMENAISTNKQRHPIGPAMTNCGITQHRAALSCADHSCNCVDSCRATTLVCHDCRLSTAVQVCDLSSCMTHLPKIRPARQIKHFFKLSHRTTRRIILDMCGGVRGDRPESHDTIWITFHQQE